MTVVDDLIAVRTLLILKGRAIGKWTDEEGRVCLRQAMMDVCNPRNSASCSAFEDPGWKAFATDFGYDATVKSDPYTERAEALTRDREMFWTLFKYLPIKIQAFIRLSGWDEHGADQLAVYNDKHATDQDILNLIDKALADLGALA